MVQSGCPSLRIGAKLRSAPDPSNSGGNRWIDTSSVLPHLGSLTVRGGRITIIAQGSSLVVEFVSTLILARLLTPDDFGIVGMMAAVVGFLGLFRSAGLDLSTIQRDQVSSRQVSGLFWINVAIGLGLTVVTVLLSPLVSLFFERPELTPIALALASTFTFGALGVQHRALLIRRMEHGRRLLAEVMATFIAIGLALVGALSGWGHWALVIKIAAIPLLSSTGYWLVCSWRPSLPKRAVLGDLLTFGGTVTAFNVVTHLARTLDDILIGKLFGGAALGYYRQAYRILMVPLSGFTSPMASVVIPTLSRLQSDPDRYRRASCRILEAILLVCSPLAAFLVGSSGYVVVFLLGDQWSPAGPILFWLGILVFVQPLGQFLGWLFISQDRSQELLRWGIIGSALSVLSFLAGLPWGVLGVAFAYSLSGLFLRLPLLVWMATRTGPTTWQDIISSSLAPTMAGGASLLTVLLLETLRNQVFPGFRLAPASGTLMALLTTTVISILMLLLLPAGRRALSDARQIFSRANEKNVGS